MFPQQIRHTPNTTLKVLDIQHIAQHVDAEQIECLIDALQITGIRTLIMGNPTKVSDALWIRLQDEILAGTIHLINIGTRVGFNNKGEQNSCRFRDIIGNGRYPSSLSLATELGAACNQHIMPRLIKEAHGSILDKVTHLLSDPNQMCYDTDLEQSWEEWAQLVGRHYCVRLCDTSLR